VDVSNQSVATTVIVLSNTSVGASSADSDTKAVRYEGQLPQVDGMDADFYSDFNTDSWCTLFLASQLLSTIL
jgi:hypothetical protein